MTETGKNGHPHYGIREALIAFIIAGTSFLTGALTKQEHVDERLRAAEIKLELLGERLVTLREAVSNLRMDVPKPPK